MDGHEQLRYLKKAYWKRKWSFFSMVGAILISFGLAKFIDLLPFDNFFNGILLILIGGTIFLIGQNIHYIKVFFPD